MGIQPAAENLNTAILYDAFFRAVIGASRFAGATSPNPPVGCVLLDRNGVVLAEGFHRKAGEPHAEADAISAARAAGLEARIHTVIVTLEPCNHHGRTPPCSDAILKTPARRVIIGTPDPNPDVAGGGAARLAAAGLSVSFAGDMAGERWRELTLLSARLIAPFVKRALTGMPWVTVKQAINVSGHMVPPKGAKTFTSEASLTLAHRLRRRADAVLTGSGTILADNPALTVRRVPDFADKKRVLAILDRRRRVPEEYIAAAKGRGFSVVIAAHLDETLQMLGALGVLEVLVEAGPSLTEAIISRSLFDEHVVIREGQPDRVSVRRSAPEFQNLNAVIFPPGEDA